MNAIGKKTKFSDLINYRLRILLIDGRTYVGTLLAFDQYLNVVLSDAEDVRIPKKVMNELRRNNNNNNSNNNINSTATTVKKEERRSLGLIILRGEQIVSMAIECGPTKDARTRLVSSLEKGKGVSRPIKIPRTKRIN